MKISSLFVFVPVFGLAGCGGCGNGDVVVDSTGSTSSTTSTITVSTSSSSTASTSSSSTSAGGGGSGVGGQGGQGGGEILVKLDVSYPADMPNGQTIYKDAESVQMFNLDLASIGGNPNIGSLALQHIGFGPISDIGDVTLVAGAQAVLGIFDANGYITFPALNYIVPNGQKKTAQVYVSFHAKNGGGTHAFRLVDASGVILNGPGEVTGTFPITGNLFMVGNISFYEMIIAADGNPSPTIVACQNGKTTPDIFPFTYQVVDEQLQVDALRFRLEALDGGRVRGTKGTAYFENLRIVDLDNNASLGFVYMGPIELDLNASAMAAVLFLDSLESESAIFHLGFIVETACSEDAQNEFFGKNYHVVWEPVQAGDILNVSEGYSPLDPNRTLPQTEIVGGSFTITPAP